jgi:hypothetical protein
MHYNRIKFTWDQLFAKGAYLAEVKPYYLYKEGIRTDQILGYSYVSVNRCGYDKVSIKVKGKEPIITNDEIESSVKDISITAKGFVGTIYEVNGTPTLSGIAEEVTLS